jgi:hypothetical protein
LPRRRSMPRTNWTTTSSVSRVKSMIRKSLERRSPKRIRPRSLRLWMMPRLGLDPIQMPTRKSMSLNRRS